MDLAAAVNREALDFLTMSNTSDLSNEQAPVIDRWDCILQCTVLGELMESRQMPMSLAGSER